MTFANSLRDTSLVARFEVLRAIRTWRALALIFLYLVAAVGAAYLFSQLIWMFEEQLAETLGAAAPRRPGAMLEQVMESKNVKRLFARMAGNESAVQAMLAYSPLAIFHLWFGLILAPFFAAAASAESISIDMRSRGLRFEALRTGRLELVMGRFGGQVMLVGMATFMAVPGTWAIGTFYMLGHEPGSLAVELLWLSFRAWAFAVPFVGLGIACSQLTTSPAWARVMAVGLTAGSWVATGVVRYYGRQPDASLGWDVAMNLLPQGWMRDMWLMDGGWAVAALICCAMGFAASGMGFLHFRRRDL